MNEPIVPDSVYDNWFRELEAMEKKNPKLQRRSSPTRNVDRAIATAHMNGCSMCSLKKYMWLKEEYTNGIK